MSRDLAAEIACFLAESGPASTERIARSIRARTVGRPHRSLDLYRMGLGVVHSRVADLRGRGHEILCWLEVGPRGERTYWYRLVREPEEAAA